MGSDAKNYGQRRSPRASRLGDSVGEGWSGLASALEPERAKLASDVAETAGWASENAAGQDCGSWEEEPRPYDVNGRVYVRVMGACLFAGACATECALPS